MKQLYKAYFDLKGMLKVVQEYKQTREWKVRELVLEEEKCENVIKSTTPSEMLTSVNKLLHLF